MESTCFVYSLYKVMLTGSVNAEYLYLFLFFCKVLKQLHPLVEDFIPLQVVIPKCNTLLMK